MGKTFNAGKAASALEQVAENKARAAAAAAAQAEQATNDVNTANDGQLTFDVKDTKKVKSAKDVKATKDAKAEIERLKAILADADTGTGAGALAALDASIRAWPTDTSLIMSALISKYRVNMSNTCALLHSERATQSIC